MKGKIQYKVEGKMVEREVNYIPVRFILAIALAVMETLTILLIVTALCYYVPYFYLAVFCTEIACVIRIIASEDNPDYKIPWLLLVLVVPVAGFMLYFLFYDRKLHKRYIKRLERLKTIGHKPEDAALFEKLNTQSPSAHSQAKMLCKIGDTHLYSRTRQEYFPLGEDMHKRLLEDLKAAEHFIFMEYFIIEEGELWDSILDILLEKAASDVEVKLDYASIIEIALPDGRTSGQQRISVNHPLSFGGYKVYQQTYGTAGAVTVRNKETGGEDRFLLNEMCFLPLDSINGVWFESLYPDYIREENGNFTLITQTSGSYEDPVYQVLVASDGVYTPVMAFPGETLSVGGVDFTFEDPVEYPGLRIKRTPEAVNTLLFAAFGLMVLGLWFCFFQTPAIVAVREEGYTVAGPKPQGLELELAALFESDTRNEETLC